MEIIALIIDGLGGMGVAMMLVRSYYRKDKAREGKEDTTYGVILAVLIASCYAASIAYTDYILWQFL